jgi:hypothetical protein
VFCTTCFLHISQNYKITGCMSYNHMTFTYCNLIGYFMYIAFVNLYRNWEVGGHVYKINLLFRGHQMGHYVQSYTKIKIWQYSQLKNQHISSCFSFQYFLVIFTSENQYICTCYGIWLMVFSATFNNIKLSYIVTGSRHGRDRMVVGFTTTSAISAYHH